MQTHTLEGPKHLPALDGVRGIAILTVMFYHFYEHFNGPHWWDKVIYYAVETGWAGVDLFFVLSGFLITRNLIYAKNQPDYFRNFYARRVLRIFPLYYLVLVFFLIFVPVFSTYWYAEDIRRYQENQTWFWFHLSNLFSFRTGYHGFLYHFWSLAIEEQFYLFWPAVLFLAKPSQIPYVCLFFCFVGVAFRGVGLLSGFDTHALHLLLPARFDTLAIGAFLACLTSQQLGRLQKWLRPALIGLIAMIVLSFVLEKTAPFMRWYRHTFYFTTLAILFGYGISLVLTPATTGVTKAAQWFAQRKFLCKMGKHSYALYIFHTIVMESLPLKAESFIEIFQIPLLAGVAYALVLGSVSLGLALVTWELFEKQFLKFKRYFPLHALPNFSRQPGSRAA